MPQKCLLLVTLVALLTLSASGTNARQSADPVAIDDDDIAGTVASIDGPEAGVWVIAETADLQTGLRKIVVTDDQGRYLVPDLPPGRYRLWVRGYGLVDSPRVEGAPGTRVNPTAVVAPDARAAARIFPASYWFSLLDIPAEDEFPGTGPSGNGIAESMRTQSHWIDRIKSQCTQCHQLGTNATREIPRELGTFDSLTAAWDRRVKSSQAGSIMSGAMTGFGRARALSMFSSWTDRITGGEVPPMPPRPRGVERNLVITQWDWADELAFVHDVTATDRRNPTLNPYGLVYGNDRYNAPDMLTLDPVRHLARKTVSVPVRDPDTPPSQPQSMPAPSPYWGDQLIWGNQQANMHNPILDERGRLWMTSTIRPRDNPAFCKSGSDHPSTRVFPLARSGRQASMYDPATDTFTLIDLCFGTHHLVFADDGTLWFSGGGQVIGWLDVDTFERTGDAAAAQGWSPFIIDTNGNGRRDAYIEADQPVDPTLDLWVGGGGGPYESGFGLGLYGIAPNPADGSIWGAVTYVPGLLVRYDPTTGLSEIYEPPFSDPSADVRGYAPRGVDVDSHGVVWTGLQSGHLASFDRRRCATLSGPTATGQHCPEGWTLHRTPGPSLRGVTNQGSADFHYYNFVDRFDTFGLGRDTPFVNGTNSDSLAALLPSGEFVVLRVPYPLGFFSRGLDGRIDDPDGGWKGRGLWAAYSSQVPWHTEGGKGMSSKVMHLQLRTDPLAR